MMSSQVSETGLAVPYFTRLDLLILKDIILVE